METVLAWIISIIVIGFFAFVAFAYGLAIIEAYKKSKEYKVKVPGRRGWFN